MHPERAMQRYFSGELGPRREAALRRHLARCEECRSYYEAQIKLLRIARGSAEEPTEDEEERLLARVLRAAEVEGLLSPGASRAPKPATSSRESIFTRALDHLLLAPVASAGAAAIVLMTFVGAGALVTGGLLSPEPVATIVEARGLVVAGESIAAEDAGGLSIHEGEYLTTDSSGLAEIDLHSGGKLRLFPGTRGHLEEGGRLVLMEQGRVWCQVDASSSPFVVRTPGGSAKVLGTSFVVEHDADGQTEVRVLEGRVEVTDAAEMGRVEVTAGRRTTIARGETPTEPSRYDGRDQSEWRGLWARLLDALQRAVDSMREALSH